MQKCFLSYLTCQPICILYPCWHRTTALRFVGGWDSGYQATQTVAHQFTIIQIIIVMNLLRGVKDWVHMKTAKMMQDFNWLCNLDVNHKLLLMFIIKVVYHCTLHNKRISPAHFVVYMLWRPTPTWLSNINA